MKEKIKIIITGQQDDRIGTQESSISMSREAYSRVKMPEVLKRVNETGQFIVHGDNGELLFANFIKVLEIVVKRVFVL